MAEDFEVTGGLPEDDENRTFVIAAAGLGGLIVLSLVCLGVYALILQPRQREAAEQEPTSIVLTNTAVALGLTLTAEAEDFHSSADASASYPLLQRRPILRYQRRWSCCQLTRRLPRRSRRSRRLHR